MWGRLAVQLPFSLVSVPQLLVWHIQVNLCSVKSYNVKVNCFMCFTVCLMICMYTFYIILFHTLNDDLMYIYCMVASMVYIFILIVKRSVSMIRVCLQIHLQLVIDCHPQDVIDCHLLSHLIVIRSSPICTVQIQSSVE